MDIVTYRESIIQLLIAFAVVPEDDGEEIRPSGSGETTLIAACRAIVSAKLGDMVSVPGDLAEVMP